MINNSIHFLKTRKVKSPNKAHQTDAGIDFYIPEFTPEFINILRDKNPEIYITDESITLDTNERILIPSGIHCQMAKDDRCLVAANKSGVATKLGLVFGAQIIDSDYQGEIHLSLINTSKYSVKLTPGQKILQFLEMPIYTSNIEITENKKPEEFYAEVTTRGASGFGDSDKK